MVKRTGPTNFQLTNLIVELKKKSIEDKVGFWKRIAEDLEKPTRQKVIVNLSRIDKNSKDNETVIIPGKVLGDGVIAKNVTVAAFNFSDSAKEKIMKAKGQIMTIEELMKKGMKLSEVRILG